MATVTHTFINSTKGTKYPRIKIFHGKKQKVEYIPIKEMRFHQLEDTKKNYLHNEKLLKELTARKNVLAEEINRGTLGVFMNSKKISLVEQIEWTIKHRGNSASTSSKYVSLLKHIIRFLELEGYSIDIKLNKIDFDFGMDFKHYLSRGGSSLRQNKTLEISSQQVLIQSLKTTLNDAHDRDLIIKNHIKKVSIPKTENEDDKTWLNLEEIRLLEKKDTKYEMMKRMFLFQCYTGLRKGDCEKMKWKEIKKIHGVLNFDIQLQKGRKKLCNIIVTPAIDILPERRNDEDLVFWGFKYNDNTNMKLRDWIKDAGVNKYVTSHVGRHTYAVNALNEFDFSIGVLSKLLGHSSVKITEKHYAQYDSKTLNTEALKMYV